MHGTVRYTELKDLFVAMDRMGIDKTSLRLSDPFPSETDWDIELVTYSVR